jgi:hypothetical protein
VTSAPAVVAPSVTCPATAELAAGGAGLPEREGAGRGATLWALFFPTGPRIVAGTEIKVAWRMTGTGDFSISATGPGGTTVRPSWGPEGHGGSTWTRPGDEWGTGWIFPTPGCWTFVARRLGSAASLSIVVAPASTSATG